MYNICNVWIVWRTLRNYIEQAQCFHYTSTVFSMHSMYSSIRRDFRCCTIKTIYTDNLPKMYNAYSDNFWFSRWTWEQPLAFFDCEKTNWAQFSNVFYVLFGVIVLKVQNLNNLFYCSSKRQKKTKKKSVKRIHFVSIEVDKHTQPGQWSH